MEASTTVHEHDLRQHLDSKAYYERAKSQTTVNTREIDVGKDASTAGSIDWRPGVKARFPKLGFAAILMMLCCIVFSIVILKTSDNKVAEQWPGMCLQKVLNH
jgi:hypothetical protein